MPAEVDSDLATFTPTTPLKDIPTRSPSQQHHDAHTKATKLKVEKSLYKLYLQTLTPQPSHRYSDDSSDDDHEPEYDDDTLLDDTFSLKLAADHEGALRECELVLEEMLAYPRRDSSFNICIRFNLAMLTLDLGRMGEAERWFTEALQDLESIGWKRVGVCSPVVPLIRLFNNGEEFKKAEELLGMIYVVLESVCGPRHTFTSHLAVLAALKTSAEDELAKVWFEKAAHLLTEERTFSLFGVLGEGHHWLYIDNLVTTYDAAKLWKASEDVLQLPYMEWGGTAGMGAHLAYRIGIYAYKQDAYEKAAGFLKAAVAAFEEERGKDDALTLKSLKKIARCYDAHEIWKEGELWWTLAMVAYELAPQFGETHPETLKVVKARSMNLEWQENFLEAERGYIRCAEIWIAMDRSRYPESDTLGWAYRDLGDFYKVRKRWKDAEEAYRLTIEEFKKSDQPHPSTSTYRGDVLREQDRLTEAAEAYLSVFEREMQDDNAESLLYEIAGLGNTIAEREAKVGWEGMTSMTFFERTVEGLTKRFGANNKRTMHWKVNVANTYRIAGRLSDAEELYFSALEWQSKNLDEGFRSADVIENVRQMMILYDVWNKFEDSLRLFEEILSRRQKTGDGSWDWEGMKYVALLGMGFSVATDAYNAVPPKLDVAERLLNACIDGFSAVLVDPGRSNQVTNSQSLLADIYAKRGKFIEAERLVRQVADERTEVWGRERDTVLVAHKQLANILSMHGKGKVAYPILCGVLETEERVHGKDSRQVLDTAFELALLCNKLSRLDEAENLARRAYEGYKTLLGPEDLTTITALSILGNILHDRLNLNEALVIFLEVSRLKEKHLGKHHPSTVAELSDLGLIYLQQNKISEAAPLLEHAYSEQTKTFGTEHMVTLRTQSNLAALKMKQGDLPSARALHEAALKTCDTMPDVHDIIRLDVSLRAASFFMLNAEPEKGLRLTERLLAGLEAEHGLKHSQSLETARHLATTYEELGRYESAEKLWVRIVSAHEDFYGKEHLHTVTSLERLARIYLVQEKPSRAKPYFMRALAGFEKLFGRDHARVYEVCDKLGLLYSAFGELGKADEMYTRALAGKQNDPPQGLGRENSGTLATQNDLGIVYRKMGRNEEALELFKDVFECAKRTVGNSARLTILALGNYAVCLAELGRFEENEELYLTHLEVLEQEIGATDTVAVGVLYKLLPLFIKNMKMEQGIALLLRLLPEFENKLGCEHATTLHIRQCLADTYRILKRPDEAEKYTDSTPQTTEKQDGIDGHLVNGMRHDFGLYLESLGDSSSLALARERFHQALAGYQAYFGPNHASTINLLFRIGMTAKKQGLTEESEEYLGKALRGFEALGRDTVTLTATTGDLGVVDKLNWRVDGVEETAKKMGRFNITSQTTSPPSEKDDKDKAATADGSPPDINDDAHVGEEKGPAHKPDPSSDLINVESPSALTALLNMCQLYMESGRLPLAVDMLNTALIKYEEDIPTTSPLSTPSPSSAKGRLSSPEPSESKDSPETITLATMLAFSHQASMDFPSAVSLFNRVLPWREKNVKGEKRDGFHYQIMKNAGLVNEVVGNVERANELFRDAVEGLDGILRRRRGGDVEVFVDGRRVAVKRIVMGEPVTVGFGTAAEIQAELEREGEDGKEKGKEEQKSISELTDSLDGLLRTRHALASTLPAVQTDHSLAFSASITHLGPLHHLSLIAGSRLAHTYLDSTAFDPSQAPDPSTIKALLEMVVDRFRNTMGPLTEAGAKCMVTALVELGGMYEDGRRRREGVMMIREGLEMLRGFGGEFDDAVERLWGQVREVERGLGLGDEAEGEGGEDEDARDG